MADDPDDELAALRRRAYSRSGTADDLRRLAGLEQGTARRPEAAPTAPVETLESPVAPSADAPIATPPPPRRRPVLIAAAAGLLAGATIATLGILLPHGDDPAGPPQDPGPTALAIFDRVPTERDDPALLAMTLDHILPGGLEDAELRWLGSVAESEVYVARGTYDDVTTICLISAQTESTGGACTEQPDFVVRGLTLGMGGLELRWGPLGTEIWIAERES